MICLELFSEPFAKTGNIAADGFRRLLGCPAQDLLQTVLREAIQNSIDAALPDHSPSLLIRFRTLTPQQHQVLKTLALADLPVGDATRQEIEKSLETPTLKVLEICDFNSTGLGGPTSGDVASDGVEPLDFVNFLRNVGVARDTYQGGGTYGYGKTSLYAMSACSTILVDSQTTCAGEPVRRLMGCHLGSAFDANAVDGKRKRFTGRHWWGVGDGDGGIDPLTGAEAAELALSLGLPQRDQNTTGTSILILDPHMDSDEGARHMDHYIQETILWNFWPRLITSTPNDKKLNIQVEIEGREIQIPVPDNFPPFDLFASAMDAYRANSDDVQILRSERPKKDLGSLVLKQGLRADRSGSALDEYTAIPNQSCHIALMRPVELVVKYVEGTPFSDARFEWAGVFICSDEDDVESAFAMSEPPAHDDWIPDTLSDRNAKTYVRGAIKRIEYAANTFATPISAAAGTGRERGPSLASTASRLGRLLDSVSGRGPGKTRPAHRGPSAKPELSISPARFIRLVINEDNYRCAIFEADLQNDGHEPALEVHAEPYLVADGAIADGEDLPESFDTRVLEMSFDNTNQVTGHHAIKVGTQSGTLTISVLSPPEAAVSVKLRLRHGSRQ